ncbi:hypothetical protein ACJIZ3_025224 [Penstemon smallii]|uniref:IBH1-like N-terminal domain-containing protein n=1 Tax=Penstemon smallii TaxID=265156 RepID=A0ABD3TXD2_9LAMI
MKLHVPACAVSFSNWPTTYPFFHQIKWAFLHFLLLSFNFHSFFFLCVCVFMMQNSSSALVKQEFLKKWIKGLYIYSNLNKEMSILDRKKAIKLSADIAIASTRNANTHWSRALMTSVSSRDGTNKMVVEQILGHKVEINKKGLTITNCSKKILRRSRIARQKARKSKFVPQKASSIAKKLVKNRTKMLKSLVPGGEELDDISLIKETLDYIVSLRVQVDVMRRFASASERLDN